MRRFTVFLFGLVVMPGCGGSEAQPATAPQKKNTPMFVERAAEFGLVFQHHSASGQYYLPESLGAGCGLFDADGDGDLDALFVRGHNLEASADAESRNTFFKNTGEGQFVDDTTNAGLTDLGYSYGVTCGDVDADGDIDLYITNFGKDCLYYNDGTGRFTKASETASANATIFRCRLVLWTTTGTVILISSSPDTWTGRLISVEDASIFEEGVTIATLSDTEDPSPIGCCRTMAKGSSPM